MAHGSSAPVRGGAGAGAHADTDRRRFRCAKSPHEGAATFRVALPRSALSGRDYLVVRVTVLRRRRAGSPRFEGHLVPSGDTVRLVGLRHRRDGSGSAMFLSS
ncbi:MAG: hypothetical protein IT373_23665 [Polyangiaceae bacterium]|nr:hypothetical protein [Polyangiaceae bacterium]